MKSADRNGLSIVGVVLVTAAAVGWPGSTQTQQEPPLLDTMFQDRAVLQRDRANAVSGRARPGDRVTVSLDGRSVHVTGDDSGRWQATLPPMPAGGPHTLTVATGSGAAQTVGDVLIGDVWLCSGQSNMEWPVARTLNAEDEIRRSASDSIRLLTVAHADSPAPVDRFTMPVAWRAATPQTVRDFSATCYYFARELQKTHQVPMGLIHSSWGGSNIEAWISAETLRTIGPFDEQLALLRLYAADRRAAVERLGAMWETWWHARVPSAAKAAPWSSPSDEGWREVPPGMGDWKTWGVGELASFHGMVWFKRTVRLTATQAARTSTLSLGGIDELDQTWINGRPIGNTFGWGTPRQYEVPAGGLREGDNLIVVNVLSTWGSGGMLGPPDAIALEPAAGPAVSLAGGWRYKPAPAGVGTPPRGPWHAIGGLTTLYNAMIAPIGSYGLRGVLWYQGESNTGNADDYEGLLAGLMSDWRRRFGPALPFLVVQLPNFGSPPAAPVASGWATLRDAQRRAVVRDGNAGLAVTIDIGDRHELHPPNKQEVGRRLARAARSIVYREAVTPSGPVALSADRAGPRVLVTFGDVEGRLVAYSADHPIGFELCGAEQASCRFVRAAIDGHRVVLEGGDAAQSATRVRYCWGDAPICTLYDHSGLPAGPFELPIGGQPRPPSGP